MLAFLSIANADCDGSASIPRAATTSGIYVMVDRPSSPPRQVRYVEAGTWDRDRVIDSCRECCHRHKERNVLDLLPSVTARRSSPGSAARGR